MQSVFCGSLHVDHYMKAYFSEGSNLQVYPALYWFDYVMVNHESKKNSLKVWRHSSCNSCYLWLRQYLTIIRQWRGEYCSIIRATKSRELFNNIYWAWGEELFSYNCLIFFVNSFYFGDHSVTIVQVIRVEISSQSPLKFSRFFIIQSAKLQIFLLRIVTPNLITSFAFFEIAFSSIEYVTSSVTLTKRDATILKFIAAAVITLREVIVASYDAILN